MFNIQALNNISATGLNRLDKDIFNVTAAENPDGILVRSPSLHERSFNDNLLAIARAGAGVNNIPIADCTEKGIVVFNTPGANANAVKELVIAAMLISNRDICGAIDWAKTLEGKGDDIGPLVEKGKSAFAGPELAGKKLGIVGLGAIGVMLANSAVHLDMEVYGYDPYISVSAAWGLSRSVQRCTDLSVIFSDCDYVSIHVPLNPSTQNMVSRELLMKAKKGIRILNMARGGLVNDKDILEAIDEGIVAKYVTDFPDAELIGKENVICIPHLGASTPESEENCAVMAADQLGEYLRYGNIKNSVNFPSLDAGHPGGHTRVCALHRNVQGVISRLSTAMSDLGINIEHMSSRSAKECAYAVLDVSGDIDDSVITDLMAVDGMIRIRVIRPQ